MKKLISVFLAAVMLLALGVPAFSASAAYDEYRAPASDLPCIYMQGQGASIITADGEVVYGTGDHGDNFDLMGAVKECLPLLKDAILTNDWTIYRNKLLDICDTVYGKVRLDENGDPQYGTHMQDTAFLATQYQNRITTGGKYALRAYNFYIDWRLDPFETAKVFHEYIQNVKKATGKDKVNVTLRCEANNIIGAYLAEYGSEDFSCLNLYISTLNGSAPISGLFAGKINLDFKSLKRFVDQDVDIEDELLSDLLTETVKLLVDIYAADGIELAIKPLLAKLYKEAVCPVTMASYGTMPGIWALVGPDDYAQAKKNMFAGQEEKYAGLIAKLDDYDKRVRQPINKVLQKAVDNGTQIAVWAKYGEYTMIPVGEDNNLISDGTVTLKDASFGATQTHMYEQLTPEYIKASVAKNGGKYISPDKVCDASTCLFPDKTWIIYNSEHRDFPSCIHELMAKFFTVNGNMDINSDPSIPQYLYCSDGPESTMTVTPLTAENGMQPNTEPQHTKVTMKEKALAFVKALFNFLLKFFTGKISEITVK